MCAFLEKIERKKFYYMEICALIVYIKLFRVKKVKSSLPSHPNCIYNKSTIMKRNTEKLTIHQKEGGFIDSNFVWFGLIFYFI